MEGLTRAKPRESGMLVSDAMVQVLERAGTKYVFGVAGSTSASLISSVSASKKMQFVSALHENASLGMADGYARASRRFGVAVLHTTPGLTTALPNLYNSFVDNVPLLVIVGDVISKSLITEPALSLGELTTLAKTVTRWSERVTHPSETMIALRRAMNILHSPEPGPCCIVVPEDVLEEEFGGQVERASYERAEVFPDPTGVKKVAQMVASSRRPVLLVGREIQSKESVDALSAMCERLAVPVLAESPYPSAYAVGFPQNHPCYLGLFRRDAEALAGCDLLIALGGQLLTERKYNPGEPFAPTTKVVHISSHPRELGKNLPTDLRLVADPEAFAAQLSAAVLKESGRSGATQERRRWIKGIWQRRKQDQGRLLRRGGDGNSVKPWQIVGALKRALAGEDYVIVDEGVIASSYLSELFEFVEPGTLIGRSAGCLGWGLSAAVGVELAQPGKKAVAFVGDGALLFGPQAIWTASHYRIPLVVVVCNNQGYTSVGLSFESLGKRLGRQVRVEGCKIEDPAVDVGLLCRSLGATCQTVTTEKELDSALQKAVRATRGVRVVDVRTDPDEKGYEVSLGASSAWT